MGQVLEQRIDPRDPPVHQRAQPGFRRGRLGLQLSLAEELGVGGPRQRPGDRAIEGLDLFPQSGILPVPQAGQRPGQFGVPEAPQLLESAPGRLDGLALVGRVLAKRAAQVGELLQQAVGLRDDPIDPCRKLPERKRRLAVRSASSPR